MRTILLCGLIGFLTSVACAVDINGQWHAEFDTQIGMQKYLFTFKTDGDKLTGKANSQVNDLKREAELKEGKITGDTLTFIEILQFNGDELRIHYTGKLGTNENEIAFTREVGDIATENFKATRVLDMKSTNSPAGAVTNAAAGEPTGPQSNANAGK